MKRSQKLKVLLCGLLVTTSLAVPLTMMAGDPVKPTLSFEGAELNVMPGGDVQLLMTVYVDHARYSDGARFQLDYNPKYLIPSDHQTNEPLVADQGTLATNDFFQYSEALYDKAENPFQMTNSEGAPLGMVDANERYLSMELWLRRDLEEGYGLEKVDLDEVEGANTYFTFDASTEKVALGTLSFRVETNELPQIVREFSGIQDQEEPWTADGDYLTAIIHPTGKNAEWNVGVCTKNGPGGVHVPANYDSAMVEAQLRYTFHFPKTIISVAAAEPDVTVNAFQAYTHGNEGDLAIVMQKYSPMVTAAYADGSRSSFLLPWEDCRVTGGTYAAAGGAYTLEQDFYEMKEDGSKVKFPVSVTARLTVTPVTLTGITADQLNRTWTLGDNLLTQVKNANDLALPREARLLTDVVPGPLSLTMPIPGWTPTMEGSKWPGEEDTMAVLLADESTEETKVHWPTNDDLGAGWAAVWAARRGTYTFAMADSYGGTPTSFSQGAIQAAWPWLTVPGDRYALDPAVRRLVGQFDSETGTSTNPEILDTQLYEVTYGQTVTDTATGHPELTLHVRRKMPGTETTDDMRENALFRVRLPNGMELGTGVSSTGAVGGPVTVESWFTEQGSYKTIRREVGTNTHTYDLVTSPGDTSGGVSNDAQREVLRRWINLGGWFSVSVNEDPNQYAWTDFIPIYVPPRPNLHIESREYNFVGDNAGLFGWPGGLDTTVALPRGSYEPVNPDGTPIYQKDETGAPTTIRKTEDYGAAVTYDGATGAEPGRLYTFTVDGTAGKWPVGTGETVTTYGPDTFADRTYAAFGAVQNPSDKTATLRKEGDFPVKEPTEKVILTYEGDTGVSYEGGNVSLVTYDTRTAGYTTRQDYTLVLKNVGDVDVYDLNIDTVTGGGDYVLLDPPAAFLPAGASTTFRLSYVYGLKNTGGTSGTEYRNTLYVTSSSHPDSKTDDLLDFDARFGVSDTDTHKVSVKVDPADGSMGTAGVVIGEYERDGGYVMDTTPSTTTFHRGERVYIAVTPEDEYTVKSFVVEDSSGATLTADKYTGAAKLPKDVWIYTFTMPDYDATVTVTMEEGIYSKLRLSNLEVFADPLKEDFAANRDLYPIWQKAFTAEEESEAALRGDSTSANYGQYLMTRGRAAQAGFDSRVSQYIVALPYDADFAQVEATLRKVVLGGDDAQIKPSVVMTLYPENFAQEGGAGQAILDIKAGDTNVPTKFASRVFDSPAVGKSNYVEIEVQYKETVASVPERRYYYVELHRAPKDPIATTYYGNSPYGMIMNAANIDGAVKDEAGLTAKDRAKNEFKANGYSFAGLAAEYVPEKAAGLNWRYHTEAWVDVDALYEPESHTGLNLYQEKDNMDLNDQALFAILGEPFEDPGVKEALDSTGRPADLSQATLEVKAVTLDMAQDKQAARFAGPDPAGGDAVDARTVALTHDAVTTDLSAPVTVPADWVGDAAVRPGLYQLEYHYPDYDGTGELVVTRPLILLAPVGDVDADAVAGATADVQAVLERMTDPLGYTAQDYPAASIFKFRSCDVNNDRNINQIDANQIRSGIEVKFYLPTGYR